MAEYTYILRDKEPVAESDYKRWAGWMKQNKRIAKTTVSDLLISTVFLGIDHSFGEGPLQLFETMVFRGGSWGEIDSARCATWEEAEAQHERFVDKARRGEYD